MKTAIFTILIVSICGTAFSKSNAGLAPAPYSSQQRAPDLTLKYSDLPRGTEFTFSRNFSLAANRRIFAVGKSMPYSVTEGRFHESHVLNCHLVVEASSSIRQIRAGTKWTVEGSELLGTEESVLPCSSLCVDSITVGRAMNIKFSNNNAKLICEGLDWVNTVADENSPDKNLSFLNQLISPDLSITNIPASTEF